MTGWLIASGVLAGLGCWLGLRELIPAVPSLSAAIDRLETESALVPSSARERLGRRLKTAVPWLPVPVQDLQLLGQEPAAWLASKVTLGVIGLALVPALSGLLALGGQALPWTIPAAGAVLSGGVLFMTPDLVTHVNAREKRMEFRSALTSYLDLVALERGAGAGPTQALEAAADVGQGWEFERIAAALRQARQVGSPPWDALSALAEQTGVPELADLAEIAGVAGQEGARILDTLAARAESMRAEALAATRAQAGARSTTMVLPIALLAGGFLVLLIFPDFYRLFG